jgi:DNA-binding LacI/PurR family transcriptional regulator
MTPRRRSDPGSRVTLAQVAARAGVSPMTASYTYNRPQRVSDATRRRVLAAASELGYPGPDPTARSLRRGSSRTVGILLGEQLTYAFEDPQAAAFLAGVAAACRDHGYAMTILPIAGTAEDAGRVHDAAADGFIVWTTVDGDPVLAEVAASRRPAVVHGGPRTDGLAFVGIDDEAAARAIGAAAFRHARRPAVLSFPVDRERAAQLTRGPVTTAAKVPFAVTRGRLRGYRAAARALGHPWAEVPVAVCARNTADDAERLALTLLDGPDRPDAVAAMSDELAVGVLRACARLGLAVPRDVALTGWDDGPAAARVDLTTVHQSLRDQGQACAQIVLGVAPAAAAGSPLWRVVERGTTRG